MIVGDSARFAIESHIETAFANPGLRALGFFVIHVDGISYGVRELEATMLACTYDGVQMRIEDEGKHGVSFANCDASEIARSVVQALYFEGTGEEVYFGLSTTEFDDALNSSRIIWAPNGDEAFDDRSFVLQFDLGGVVRLIAFRRSGESSIDSSTLTDLWLPKSDFYAILQEWYSAFTREWEFRLRAASIHP